MSNGEILKQVQNDRGKYNSHSEGYNQANSASAKLFTPEESQTRPERKVLKQLTPAQKAALSGKNNTSRTAKSGMLRQY